MAGGNVLTKGASKKTKSSTRAGGNVLTKSSSKKERSKQNKSTTGKSKKK
jgi:hypothetical protein